ncbi:TPA: endonuclease domain-containing protein [Listeria monocytogenes]
MNLVRCWECGQYISQEASVHFRDLSGGRNLCVECQHKYRQKIEEKKKEYIAHKIEATLERAIHLIEKQEQCSMKMEEYLDPYNTVAQFYRNDSSKFDSAHEVMACIELLRSQIKVKTQQRIGRKRVDFILPDMKVVLEIDGGHHRFRIGKDSERDVFILNTLNKSEHGWEIIRIPTRFIEQNIRRLVPAIKALYKERQELRNKHNGFIPSYYSRTNKMSHISAIKGVASDNEIEVMEQEVLDGTEDL